MTHRLLNLDWKDNLDAETLEDALRPFGVYVHENTALRGTDTTGFIFSDKPLSQDEIQEISGAEENDLDDF